mmetsp:Transcript_10766/g.23860  ORF Transcript_10766/g.23860 Transcript_10766/m.23860 type:complete len:320 (-) Transcript_10766:301-1260(-)|eukprot:CAMPEP_0172325450 /NCGR_PEP_ID=MMETSP1058-20130122/54080_1 /TAXON_ID=83371 /ORGANISM="Detonula confervacea, Strain CCMP 353" /LENGTH=319 /DNA_ID=CAMNT_0013041995 /DNA_START=94 /DNA_END=1053 /DNA_ORIENTATION=-
MSTSGDIIKNSMDNCAACGKAGHGLKKCVACKMVKYCDITCQKNHRPSHKKECRKRAAELHDEALFKQPTMEDCAICFLPISCGVIDAHYQSCCGKTVCHGCIYTVGKEMEKENRIRSSGNKALLNLCCPFCRTQKWTKDEEGLRRIKKRMESNDADAFILMGWAYHNGSYGLTQDRKKGFEHWLKGSELGSPEGHNNVAMAYFEGRGVQQDEKRAIHYMELAAMGGEAVSRHNLGTFEQRECKNMKRALRHWMIAAGAGFDDSLETIKQLFTMGHVSKADYETTLRAHSDAVDEMKSEQRNEAAASADNSVTPPVRYG